MLISRLLAWIGSSAVAATMVLVACSSPSNGTSPSGDGGPGDSGTDTSMEASSDGMSDAGAGDAANDAPAISPGLHIVAVSGHPLAAAAGDAIPLQVVMVLDDGGIQPLPAGTSVAWIAPSTIVAQDPYDAGGGILPAFGDQPTGIFIDNAFRTDRHDYAGTLFVIDPGDGGGMLTVTAVVGDASMVSTTLPVVPTPAGNADAGGDSGPEYDLQGTLYPYPAPGLNNTSPGGQPNLAADPAWNAALLGMAAQGDMDNMGVALRAPMPDWLGKMGLDGGPLGAQDFADIYAFLKTQTQ